MPHRLRRLNGEQVIQALHRCGFREMSHQGSHAKLRRAGASGEKQTIVVPSHSYLATGTLRAIIREAASYLSEEEIDREFYTK